MALSHSLIPLSNKDAEVVRKGLIDFWNAIDQCDDLRGVPWGSVRETEIRVTELLQSNQVPDVYEASRITAEFLCKYAPFA
jgi:hypothetical protein